MKNLFSNSLNPISAIDLKLKIDQKVLIIDTRFTSSIFTTGSIPSSIFIGIQGNIEAWSHVLIQDKSEEIYLITEDNIDLNELTYRFNRAGFKNIKGYLEGGIEAWIKEKFQIETYNFIYPTNFIQEVDNIDFQSIIDVRSEREFQHQHINGSKNIPLESLLSNLHEFDADNQYYIICQGGYRSIIAASILKKNSIHQTIDVYGGIKNFS
ncbi:MAG: rhodanese-like domain-containing protein [Flavobacteriaceae bacterium]|nr:rhodanese-like domain-containing protein [Flavobacteriaceae bacterium]